MQTLNKLRFTLMCIGVAMLPSWSGAQTVPPAPPAVVTSESMTAAEVRKVDRDSEKITLKHDPIKNLDMPAMTMVFRVKDKAMLDKVKVGDKVMVSVVNENGKMTVTDLRAAQ